MSVRVQCPSCGGPVVFDVGSSMVAVCPYCRSAVARGDRSVEDLGKVADLVDTGAILRVGLEGKFEGRKFRLTGRTQLGHEAGGVWDEWYAAFGDNRWGWLSEAQGRFYLLFARDDGAERPDYQSLEPGEAVPVEVAETRFVVAETGTATVKGAEGEIPYRLVPGSTYLFADLSGSHGEFATLDYSEVPPALYVGREATLDELGIPESVRREAWELRQVGAKQINCPNCGGHLDLRAPDKTERVGCPYCGSLLDATQGNLTLLEALQEPAFELLIPLGGKGAFGDDERTVIGAIQRSVTIDGADYYWQEYLLYDERDGFEWLVRSDNHWTRAKGVPAGAVDEGKTQAAYKDHTFRLFQAGTATVRGVIGECYWKVHIGEQAYACDYIRPPELLSSERSTVGNTNEINWSLGTYLTPAEVQQAFALEQPLPAPKGVAPNQVFPYSGIYKYAAYLFIALCVVGMLVLIVAPGRKVHEQTFQLRPATPTEPNKSQEYVTDLFELKGRRNIRITVACPNLNGWLVVEGDLVQQSNGLIQPFLVPLAHYRGIEEGEEWTEGDHADTIYLSAQPAGQYSLRLEVEKEHPELSGPLTVRIDQGAAHAKTWLLAFIGLMLLPAGVGIYHLIFSSTRWANSDIREPETPDEEYVAPPVEPTPDEPPIPLAEAGSTGLPVARPLKRKKKKPKRRRDDDDD